MTLPRKSLLAGLLGLTFLGIAASEDKKRPPDDKDVAQLLSDDVDVYIAARRRILGRGPSCQDLVAAQLKQLEPSQKRLRLRLEPLLKELELAAALEAEAKRLEPLLRRAEDLQKAESKSRSRFAVLPSRQKLVRGSPYEHLCYFSFPKGESLYDGTVSLGFGNGSDALDVVMLGGQGNTLRDMGDVDFAGVASAPDAKETALWGTRVNAVKGHVYVEHCLDGRESIDQAFKFKVVDMKEGEWIVIEWEAIPQDK